LRKVPREAMARNSLSALDFIVSVLREHEKELTELSERLENTLALVKGENVRRALDELTNSVQALSKTIGSLCEKIGSQVDAGIRFRETIDSLREESQTQRVQVNDILDQLKALPTRDDLEDLRRAIDTLNALLAKEKEKPTDVLKD
jgi:predicted  nucleic acid-binding Zn-ribbon protein